MVPTVYNSRRTRQRSTLLRSRARAQVVHTTPLRENSLEPAHGPLPMETTTVAPAAAQAPPATVCLLRDRLRCSLLHAPLQGCCEPGELCHCLPCVGAAVGNAVGGAVESR